MAAADQPDSLGALLGGLLGDLGQLVRGEIALARTEIDEKLQTMATAGIWLMGGALVAFAGLVVMLQGIAFALAAVMPAWAAWLVVGLTIIGVGALVARYGLSLVTLKALTPEKTGENLQKDANMLKEHI